MSHGLQCFDSTGSLLIDTSDIGGVFVERISLSIGDSGTKTYNADVRFSGRSIRCIQSGPGGHDWTTDTSGGYPRLNWTAKDVGFYTAPTALLVFAL